MSSEATLLQMPNLAMGRVMEYLNYLDIIHVKRTCVSLRDVVAANKPNVRFWALHLYQDNDNVRLSLLSSKNSDSVKLEYKRAENGCIVEAEYNGAMHTKTLEGTDYIEALCYDLVMFLRHHKSVMKKVCLSCCANETRLLWERIAETLARVERETLKKPLFHSKHWVIINLLPTEILQLIHFFDHTVLDEIDCVGNGLEPISGIEETPQWRNAKHVTLIRNPIVNLAQHVSHFEFFVGKTITVTAENIRRLKDQFLQSRTFKFCNIDFQRSENMGGALWPNALQSGEEVRRWYFKSPVDGKVLFVKLSYNSLDFAKKNVQEIPENAVLIE